MRSISSVMKLHYTGYSDHIDFDFSLSFRVLCVQHTIALLMQSKLWVSALVSFLVRGCCLNKQQQIRVSFTELNFILSAVDRRQFFVVCRSFLLRWKEIQRRDDVEWLHETISRLLNYGRIFTVLTVGRITILFTINVHTKNQLTNSIWSCKREKNWKFKADHFFTSNECRGVRRWAAALRELSWISSGKASSSRTIKLHHKH